MYALFCVYFAFDFLPITSFKLCIFIYFMHRTIKSYGSLQSYLSGLKVLQRLNGYSVQAFESFNLQMVMRAIRKTTDHVAQKKLPITPTVLLDLYKQMDMTNMEHLVLWSVFLIVFFTMFRKSNLVVPSTRLFDNFKHLTRDKIHVVDDGLLIDVTWSKVLNFRNKLVQVPIFNLLGSPLLAPFWYGHMCRLIPAPSNSPAFVVPSKSGLEPLTYSEFVLCLQKFLTGAGYKASLYSGHSFRHGGATYLAKNGFALHDIMSLGDWSSDSVLGYIKNDLADRKLLAKQFASKVLASSY